MLLEAVPESIRSSYDVKGRTMLPGRKPIPFDKLRTLHGRSTGKATPGTVRAMVAADDALRAAGCAGLRVTEAYRPWSVQEKTRVAFEVWVDAGRPRMGEPGWRSGMKPVFVCRPGESQHGWGGANDWHVYVFGFPGIRPGSDASLSALWDVVRPLGWRPVLREPKMGMAECWHFDHFGPLEAVRGLYYAHRRDGSKYRNAYGNTAVAGHALVGTWSGDRRQERYLQAQILLGGEWIGLVDGRPGRQTRGGFERLTGEKWPGGSRTTPKAVAEAIGIVGGVKRVRDALADL